MKYFGLIIGFVFVSLKVMPQTLSIDEDAFSNVKPCKDCMDDNYGKKVSKLIVSAQNISINNIIVGGRLFVEEKINAGKKIVFFLPNRGQNLIIYANGCDTLYITIPDYVGGGGEYQCTITYNKPPDDNPNVGGRADPPLLDDKYYTITHDDYITTPATAKGGTIIPFYIQKKRGYKFGNLFFNINYPVSYSFKRKTYQGTFTMPHSDIIISTYYSRKLFNKIVEELNPFSIWGSWKRERQSVYGGLGVVNALFDISSNAIYPSYCLGYEYRLFEGISLLANFQQSVIYGVNNNIPYDSGKNFKTNLLEYGVGISYYYIKQKVISRFEAFQSVLQWKQRFSSYIYFDFDFLHFNPKGKIDGKWIKLQRFNTEGQGTGYTSTFYDNNGNSHQWKADKKYKLTTPTYILGLGVKYRLNSKMGIIADISYHFANTDYLDDVHSDYYFNYQDAGIISNNTIIEKNNIYRVDNIGSTNIKTLTYNQNHQLGEFGRGNSKNNDNFFSVLFTFYVLPIANFLPSRKPQYY